jgi:hypothetical protein
MKSTYSTLLQSKFFNPAFNSAIFDGPVRIYFSQFHEALALKIYFGLQQNLTIQKKGKQRQNGQNVLVMLYPTQESFQMTFEGQESFLVCDTMDGDSLIGINGPFEDDKLPEVLSAIANSISEPKFKRALEASLT